MISVNSTDNLIWEVQDQVQRLDRKVSALLTLNGIDPDEAGRLPDDAPARM
ncbi:MAG TPA: hypothetical protein VGH53_00735 [Streptosporangiaceae bacterium]